MARGAVSAAVAWRLHLRAVKVKGPLNPDAWERWFPQACAGVCGVPRRQVRPEQSGAEREDVKLGEDGGRGAENGGPGSQLSAWRDSGF